MSLDLDILEILNNCDYPQSSYRNFAGWSRAELRRLSYNDLEDRVRSTLPPGPDRPSLVARFISSLSNPEGQGDPQSTDMKPLIKQEVKIEEVKVEVADSSKGSNPAPPSSPQLVHEANVHVVEPETNPIVEQGQVDGTSNSAQCTRGRGNYSDSDVEFVEEVQNVSIIRVLDAETKAKERIVHVTVQDEEDEQQMEEGTSVSSIPLPLNGVSSGTELASRRKRKRAQPERLQVSDSKGQSYDPPKGATRTIFTLGKAPTEGSIPTVEWTLDEFNNLTSLPISTFVKELSIISNCNYDEDSSSYSGSLSLPLLTTLKIRHPVKESDDSVRSSIDINYSSQLTRILAGAPVLSRIEMFCKEKMAVKSLLGVLVSMPELGSLSSLTIKPYKENECITFFASGLEALAKINAPNLAELQLYFCIWANDTGVEVKNGVESMLRRFPILTKLKIEGFFVTSTNPFPKIVLDFPKLPKLEILDLGSSCKYSSTFETVESAPKKKMRKKLAIRSDPEQDENNLGPALPNNLIKDKPVFEFFPVSINLPGLMPALTSIHLGVLYELNTFYFSELPSLKIFRVASQWAQSYPAYFPVQALRKGQGREKEGAFQKCPVVELQFPDFFQDCYMLPKILRHFPNITHIYINLPTVKFLRAFAKTMEDLGPASFQHLILKTQFDFASSLDSCILDKIQEPSPAELEKIKILKAYPHWKDYVVENSIEVPDDENVEADDGTQYCGLGGLFNNLKEMKVRHLPRTLRIPKGPRHWIDDQNPEYTDTLIGFKEYPFQKVTYINFPKIPYIGLVCFDLSQVAHYFKVSTSYSERELPFDPTNSGMKREVKAEPEYNSVTHFGNT